MKLLRLISIFFVIYFIRRFIQAYKAMKYVQEENERLQRAQAEQQQQQTRPPPPPNQEVINADFRVID